jgi:hypothetical protein
MRSSVRAGCIAASLLLLAPAAATANRQIGAAWNNPPGAPLPLYSCRGEEIYGIPHRLMLGGYFQNQSGKDVTALGVHFRLLRLDGSQIVGIGLKARKRVTAGTKNNLEWETRIDFDGVDHIECEPYSATFADGTEWKSDADFDDRPTPANPSPAPSPSATP